jgi:hypothetical protein
MKWQKVPDTYAIIPCTNQKSNTPGKARDLWVGHHFQLTLAIAEFFFPNVLIMSYKYGLIDPDYEIEPYDIDIKTASAYDKLMWWFKMREDIEELCEKKPLLVAMYTGDVERERILREFVKHGTRQVILPWEGKSIGMRMQAAYDGEPPFEPDKAHAHAYDLPETLVEATETGAVNKYLPPPSKLTDDINWE